MLPEDFKKIVWIASYPKSGNTWIRMLMDVYFFGGVDINDVIASAGDSREEFYQIDSQSPKRYPLNIQHCIRPAALTKMVLQHMQRNFAGVPMFLKTHNVNAEVGGLDLLPTALTRSVLYVTRDPRDVLPSFAKHMGLAHDEAVTTMTAELGYLSSENKIMLELTSSWAKHVRSYITEPQKNVGVFRYEDLNAAPEETFTSMLRHIGLEPDESKVKDAVEACELAKLKQQEEVVGFCEKSSKADKFFGATHDPLSAKHRALLESAFSREMKQLGYL